LASSNAYNGVRGLHDLAHVRVNQRPVGSPFLLSGLFVKNKTVSVQFSSVTSLCVHLTSLVLSAVRPLHSGLHESVCTLTVFVSIIVGYFYYSA